MAEVATIPTDKAKAIEGLKGQFEDLESVELCGMEFVYALPNKPEAERFQDRVSREPNKASAYADLVLHCVKYPEREVLTRELHKRHFLLVSLANRITAFAGLDTETQAKKL